ncbi:MAG: virulence RhuM family protein [Coriobacteriales bacterium]|jgi:hypothetical protein|nr:virulence RhuM family protein [Coriobacteriales bacterium]
MNGSSEIVLFQPDKAVRLEVLLDEETVWLTQRQMAELFSTTRSNITMHISNIFKEGELKEEMVSKESLLTTQHGAIKGKMQTKAVRIYSLDVIISVGYRVKSQRGTQFRIWATGVLKEYLLRGYAVNQKIERLERRMGDVEEKVNFFVKTALPPREGVFSNGQIFDAYTFASDLVKKAERRIILLDNYVDETVLLLLSKRRTAVKATVYTRRISKQLQHDLTQHNAQYAPIEIEVSTVFHDRFLIIDNTVYHIGASLKDLGKRLFAFSKMDIKAADLLKRI